jgi:hypothetical protein
MHVATCIRQTLPSLCSARPRRQDTKKRPAVLVMHALMQDSESFLCGGMKHSLALQLAGAGFDVWLGEASLNSRGQDSKEARRSREPADEQVTTAETGTATSTRPYTRARWSTGSSP